MENKNPSELRTHNSKRLEDQKFRMNKIRELDRYLKTELNQRRSVTKKYKRAYNTLFYFEGALLSLGLVSVGSGLVLTASVVGVLGLIPGGAIGVAALAISAPIHVYNQRVRRKIEKHKKIEVLIITKLSSLHRLVSKVLDDSEIDEKEFVGVLDELKQYERLKEKIRQKALEIEEVNENRKRDSLLTRLKTLISKESSFGSRSEVPEK